MSKLIVLLLVLGALYYIGTNYKSVDINETKEQLINSVENAGPIGAVREGRMKQQKTIMDAVRF